jgi:hypothetical protein
MSKQFSMLGVMNAAMLAQGQLEIVAENDGSMAYRTMARNWPAVVEAELEDGAYHFTRQQQNLVTRALGKFGYADAFMVPDAALHVRDCWILNSRGQRCEVDWLQDSTHVYLDNPDGCWIEYVNCPEPNLWSANFARGVQKRMEAIIARAIREEFGEAQGLDQEAEMYFQRARTNSSKARSQRPFYKQGPISRARRTRG